MNKESFKIAVPDAVLADLRERLARVRYPIDFANENWAYGTNRAYLEELVAYWRDQYDWRKHEAEINRFAHYRTTIDGVSSRRASFLLPWCCHSRLKLITARSSQDFALWSRAMARA